MRCSSCEWLKSIQNCWGQEVHLCVQTESAGYLKQCGSNDSCTWQPGPALPVLYHVTPSSNVDSIRKSGLVPQIGERSKAAGEESPAIYLFASKEEMEQACWSWLGEEFENESIAVLEVRLPKPYLEELAFDEFEIRCQKPIPPQYIQFFDEWGSEI